MKALIEQIKKDLKDRLSEYRFKHTESVVKTALSFTQAYELDKEMQEKIELAAWLHDCCKELKTEELAILAKFYGIKIHELDMEEPNLLHARVGAKWCEDEYEIYDAYVLKAIEEHTLGGKNMLVSSKILFLADMLEPGRDKNKTSKDLEELRSMIQNKVNLDEVLLKAFDVKIKYILSKKQALHPLSIESRNNLLKG